MEAYKDRTRKIVRVIGGWVRPLVVALVLVAVLRITGAMSYVSFASQWALIKAGLRNTDATADTKTKPFDFNFTIKDLEGNKIPFEKFKGKVIFLNLWATWCGPCRAEMPGIHDLYGKMDSDKVVFIMLSIDKDSDHPKIVNYMQKNKYTFTAYQPSGYLTEQLNVPVIPTTFIISKDGTLVKKQVGSFDYDTDKFRKFLGDLSQ